MPALDTIASFQTTVGSTFAAGVMATGDSAQVRNFPQPGLAQLVAAYSDHVTGPSPWRARSPLLHDNVQGIRFFPGQSPAATLLPRQVQQGLEAQDLLTFEQSTAAATGKALTALGIYYPQLPGAMSRLYSLADIDPLIKNIKPVIVTIGAGANTAGQWLDTLITATENLLHANTDYAVLGITTDTPVAAIAVKGIDTGNLRCSAPGILNNDVTSDWFVRLSLAAQLPLIPVINAANAPATFVSIISAAATAAILDAQLVLAELSHNLS
jgi:hypothetical protein